MIHPVDISATFEAGPTRRTSRRRPVHGLSKSSPRRRCDPVLGLSMSRVFRSSPLAFFEAGPTQRSGGPSADYPGRRRGGAATPPRTTQVPSRVFRSRPCSRVFRSRPTTRRTSRRPVRGPSTEYPGRRRGGAATRPRTTNVVSRCDPSSDYQSLVSRFEAGRALAFFRSRSDSRERSLGVRVLGRGDAV